MINTRVRIEYSDQNEEFALCLPKSGTIVKRLSDTYGNDNWWLVYLDEPIEYQLTEDTRRVVLKYYVTRYLLIRPRWVGYAVGKKEPAAVFIFLLNDDNVYPESPFRVEDYHHVAWGMCHTE